MDLHDSSKKFLDALSTLCEIYGVTLIKGGEYGSALFVLNGSEVMFEYRKPVESNGIFYGLKETNYAVEYQPEEGNQDEV